MLSFPHATTSFGGLTQCSDGVRKRNSFRRHPQLYHIPTFGAHKTVPEILTWRDVRGGTGVLMKGAKSHYPASPFGGTTTKFF
jgi:hypothetical protein